MEAIIDWVKGILGCLLFMSLVLQGVPGKAYIPYLRLFMGILLILTVLSPITDPTGISDTLGQWIDRLAFREEESLSDQLLKGEEWLENQIKEKAEELAAQSSSLSSEDVEANAKDEEETKGVEMNTQEEPSIRVEVEVNIAPIEPVKPADKGGGENNGR